MGPDLEDDLLFGMSIVDWEERMPETLEGHFGRELHTVWHEHLSHHNADLDIYCWQHNRSIDRRILLSYGAEQAAVGHPGIEELYRHALAVSESRKVRQFPIPS